MDLYQAILKREELRQKALQLDEWISHQGSRESRDSPLRMPKHIPLSLAVSQVIDNAWAAYAELDDKIQEATKGMTVEMGNLSGKNPAT